MGLQFRLDEYLFERVMCPHDPSLQVVPTSHLSVQQRMHPGIVAITSLTYFYLASHPQSPPPVDVRHRTYCWIADIRRHLRTKASGLSLDNTRLGQ